MSRCVLFILGIAIALCSCSKKTYQVGVQGSYVLSPTGELLASYIWREATILAYKLVGTDTITYNITKQFDGTDQDDLTIFREDGTFLFEEGQTKYTPHSTQKYYIGIWHLSADQKKLTLQTNSLNDEYQIIRLDSTELVLKLSVQNEENTYFYLLTYTAAAKTDYRSKKEQLAKNDFYTKVDQQPQYPGGYKELHRFVSKQQKYPAEARRNNIQGKVVVQFVISREGVASKFQVVESLGYGCDEAVLQTCKAMIRWRPGLLNGKPVPVQVTLPIVFKL